jgi:hypothetical protein
MPRWTGGTRYSPELRKSRPEQSWPSHAPTSILAKFLRTHLASDRKRAPIPMRTTLTTLMAWWPEQNTARLPVRTLPLTSWGWRKRTVTIGYPHYAYRQRVGDTTGRFSASDTTARATATAAG